MYLNYRRAAVVAATGLAVVGVAGTALASTGGGTVAGHPSLGSGDTALTALSDPSGTPSGTPKDHDGKHKGKHGALGKLKRLDHAVVVTTGKDGKTVTRTLWLGTVTAVSPTSVTLQSRDKKTQTYAVTKDTAIKVKVKGQKPKDETIAQLAKGDRVFASGTGTGTVTAQRLLELPAK